jgi:hypothetical protein
LKKDLETTLAAVGLPQLLVNLLKGMGIYTLGDLTNVRRSQLLEHKNFSKISIGLVESMMDEEGLRIGENCSRVEVKHTNNVKGRAVVDFEDPKLRMHETYEGQVEHVGENTVVVVYNVNGELVEHTYEKKQFQNGKLPTLGTCLKTFVYVVEQEPKPPTDTESESATGDEPSHREPLTGPVEF